MMRLCLLFSTIHIFMFPCQIIHLDHHVRIIHLGHYMLRPFRVECTSLIVHPKQFIRTYFLTCISCTLGVCTTCTWSSLVHDTQTLTIEILYIKYLIFLLALEFNIVRILQNCYCIIFYQFRILIQIRILGFIISINTCNLLLLLL